MSNLTPYTMLSKNDSIFRLRVNPLTLTLSFTIVVSMMLQPMILTNALQTKASDNSNYGSLRRSSDYHSGAGPVSIIAPQRRLSSDGDASAGSVDFARDAGVGMANLEPHGTIVREDVNDIFGRVSDEAEGICRATFSFSNHPESDYPLFRVNFLLDNPQYLNSSDINSAVNEPVQSVADNRAAATTSNITVPESVPRRSRSRSRRNSNTDSHRLRLRPAETIPTTMNLSDYRDEEIEQIERELRTLQEENDELERELRITQWRNSEVLERLARVNAELQSNQKFLDNDPFESGNIIEHNHFSQNILQSQSENTDRLSTQTDLQRQNSNIGNTPSISDPRPTQIRSIIEPITMSSIPTSRDITVKPGSSNSIRNKVTKTITKRETCPICADDEHELQQLTFECGDACRCCPVCCARHLRIKIGEAFDNPLILQSGGSPSSQNTATVDPIPASEFQSQPQSQFQEHNTAAVTPVASTSSDRSATRTSARSAELLSSFSLRNIVSNARPSSTGLSERLRDANNSIISPDRELSTSSRRDRVSESPSLPNSDLTSDRNTIIESEPDNVITIPESDNPNTRNNNHANAESESQSENSKPNLTAIDRAVCCWNPSCKKSVPEDILVTLLENAKHSNLGNEANKYQQALNKYHHLKAVCYFQDFGISGPESAGGSEGPGGSSSFNSNNINANRLKLYSCANASCSSHKLRRRNFAIQKYANKDLDELEEKEEEDGGGNGCGVDDDDHHFDERGDFLPPEVTDFAREMRLKRQRSSPLLMGGGSSSSRSVADLKARQLRKRINRVAGKELSTENIPIDDPNSGYQLLTQEESERSFQCRFCSRCIHCGMNYHEHEPNCDVFRRTSEADRSLEEFMSNEDCKKCPSCAAPIWKNGGCIHMTCGRPNCRYEFYWCCLQRYNGGQGHTPGCRNEGERYSDNPRRN